MIIAQPSPEAPAPKLQYRTGMLVCYTFGVWTNHSKFYVLLKPDRSSPPGFYKDVYWDVFSVREKKILTRAVHERWLSAFCRVVADLSQPSDPETQVGATT